ncbi:uncharacterized protein PHALS_07651 [Plasmopara halstedii]|uniref:Uncharacterized protein n=1 Tax=Plasmopara halstedii TaxID=4781 RepID=A0A0N7L8H8_PLAHL|nr:uncharacterized protein PHALS_07651 [Plasmopara halstedii]CEG49915.1 hypothetical protein PHALS_07651 [Plasmopara halstedii]|eukprot:XP_024586284.1 hypothetical protein PHALS_07651 [Plasmopara halstedii]
MKLYMVLLSFSSSPQCKGVMLTYTLRGLCLAKRYQQNKCPLNPQILMQHAYSRSTIVLQRVE